MEARRLSLLLKIMFVCNNMDQYGPLEHPQDIQENKAFIETKHLEHHTGAASVQNASIQQPTFFFYFLKVREQKDLGQPFSYSFLNLSLHLLVRFVSQEHDGYVVACALLWKQKKYIRHFSVQHTGLCCCSRLRSGRRVCSGIVVTPW